MALIEFTTNGNSTNPANNRVAINPDQVVAVTPLNDQTTVHLALPAGAGYLSYILRHSFDDVVAQLEG